MNKDRQLSACHTICEHLSRTVVDGRSCSTSRGSQRKEGCEKAYAGRCTWVHGLVKWWKREAWYEEEEKMRKLVCGLWLALTMLASAMTAFADEQSLQQQVDDLEKLVGTLQSHLSEIEQTQLKSENLRVYWKDGINFDSANEAFKLKITGRTYNDWAWMSADDDLKAAASDFEDGTEFRAARLAIEGTIYDRTEIKAEYDFAGGSTAVKDVYMGVVRLPVVGNVRVGHFKEPFSIEELTSSRFITFMERSLVNTFAPSRNMGLMLYNPVLNDRMTWAAGVFREVDNFGKGIGDGKYAYTGRITGLPWCEEEGRKLLHLGIAYSHRVPNDETVQFKRKPDADLAPSLVDTGKFAAEQMDLVGAEAALVYGPASLQAEFVDAMVDGPGGNNPDFSAYYVMGSHFITGENRPYKTATAAFDRVRPKKNFLSKGGGAGAWEVAARYAHIDLTDEAVKGGELDTITAGLNWYLNPNMRVMWNYTFADADKKYNGNANIFQMRFQFDF